MIGQMTTCDHTVFNLPPLLEWRLTYTGSVPCDCFTVTFPYTAEMARPLSRAAGFTAMDGGNVLLRGIVDEYVIFQTSRGRTASLTGRGLAARLLDNESRPYTYQSATLQDILRNHVTPYGITCAAQSAVRASSVYTVAAGSSQWKALESFCRAYGGFSPRFTRDGRLLAAPESHSGRRILLDGTAKPLELTLRGNHYGVLSEVLVLDKTRGASYTVKNQDFQNRGGQCRRVLYTPGQSTWAAMRYTGEYQIARSREDEIALTVRLPGGPPAYPGEIVRVERSECGLSGEYRVAETEHALSAAGETTTLELKEIS